MKQISIDQDVFAFLTRNATPPGESPAAVLRRELRVPLPQKTTPAVGAYVVAPEVRSTRS